VSLGPKSVADKLHKIFERFETNQLLSQMEGLREKLDQYHRHVILVSVGDINNFYLFGAVDHFGRKLVGLSIANPFERNSPIYVLKSQLDLVSTYEELLGVRAQFQRCGIVRLPLNFKALCVVGDEDFLGKEIFKEKVYGERRLSFSEIIDEAVYNKLKTLNGSMVDLVKVQLLDEGILCLVKVPNGVEKSHISLLAEIAQVLKGRYASTCEAKYQSVASASPVLTSLCFGYEQFFKGFDVENFCRDFSNKLMRAYECILRSV